MHYDTSAPVLNHRIMGQRVIEGDMVLIGGWPDLKIPVTHYEAIMRKARKQECDPDKYLAVSLLKNPGVFNPI